MPDKYTINPFKGRTVDEGQEVFVYRNLHNDLWSIRMAKKPYHVLGHAEAVLLTDCEFRVSEKGRQRVLREKEKNIHAGVVGKLKLEGINETINGLPVEQVTYNPYKYDSFVSEYGNKVFNSSTVLLSANKRVWSELGKA